MELLEDKVGALSKRLARQGRAMAKTIHKLRMLNYGEPYAVARIDYFAGGAVVIQGMASSELAKGGAQ